MLETSVLHQLQGKCWYDTLCIGKTWNASIFEIEKPAGEGRE